jgi:ABC-type antimicrobial peptide transport system permease subunit
MIRPMLFRVAETDTWSMGGAVGVLLVAAAAAAWLPPRYAARIDPIEALRRE